MVGIPLPFANSKSTSACTYFYHTVDFVNVLYLIELLNCYYFGVFFRSKANDSGYSET